MLPSTIVRVSRFSVCAVAIVGFRRVLVANPSGMVRHGSDGVPSLNVRGIPDDGDRVIVRNVGRERNGGATKRVSPVRGRIADRSMVRDAAVCRPTLLPFSGFASRATVRRIVQGDVGAVSLVPTPTIGSMDRIYVLVASHVSVHHPKVTMV